MTKQLLIILLFPFLIFSQSNSDCKKEIIERDNYYYNGCLNYEGEPEGIGYEKNLQKVKYRFFLGISKMANFIAASFL